MKKKVIIAIAVVVTMFALYFWAFHGICDAFVANDGCIYYDSRQYCFGWLLWQRRWSDPADAPYPTEEHGIMGPGTLWRGFGLLWKRTVHYL